MIARDLDQNFSEALNKMREKYKTNEQIAKHINDYFGIQVYGKTTIDNYYTNPTAVQPSRKIGFIAASNAIFPTSEAAIQPDGLYKTINKLISGPENHILPVELNGLYRYWRFFPDGLPKEDLRWGIVRISTTNSGESIFEHWSTDAITPLLKKNKDLAANPFEALKSVLTPEDVGYAFYASEVLLTLGFREGNIRLAVAQAQPKFLERVELNGMILSKRNPGNLIFSSCFLMFHQTHPEVNDIISGDEFRSRTKFYVGQRKKLMVWS